MATIRHNNWAHTDSVILNVRYSDVDTSIRFKGWAACNASLKSPHLVVVIPHKSTILLCFECCVVVVVDMLCVTNQSSGSSLPSHSTLDIYISIIYSPVHNYS